jgi:hypothetical protein
MISWVTVLRGEGRCRHRAPRWDTIKKYVGYVRPVLHSWQTQVDGFREITHEHVILAIKQRQGNVARGVHVGLRSLFRALKQERGLFRGPTKGIVVSAVERACRRTFPPTGSAVCSTERVALSPRSSSSWQPSTDCDRLTLRGRYWPNLSVK